MTIVLLTAIAFVVFGIVGYLVGIYNGLIRVKHNIDKAWANIEVLLKQRHDELPKLTETCKFYMKYEKELLKKLTEARTSFLNAPDIERKTKAENQLEPALKTLFAVSENYPELKADQIFHQLQKRISGLENEIADRREFFNDSVNIFNIKIEQFPDLFFASALGYQKETLLEIPREETTGVNSKV